MRFGFRISILNAANGIAGIYINHFRGAVVTVLLRSVGVGIAVLLLGVVALFIYKPESVLESLLSTWSVTEDSFLPADAIFVLGGGNPFRPRAAGELWKQSVSKKIYIFGSGSDSSAITVNILTEEFGVDHDSIILLSMAVDSTIDEARLAAGVVEANNYKRVIIPTDHFNSRRVRWVFRKNLTNTEVLISNAEFYYFDLNTWWQHGNARGYFFREIIKYFYYRLRY